MGSIYVNALIFKLIFNQIFMKKILKVLSLSFLSFYSSSTILAQNEERSMAKSGVLARLLAVVETLEAEGLEVVKVEADIIRTEKVIIRTLDPSFEYGIAAFGSDRILDINIEVYVKDGDAWKHVESDDAKTEFGVVTFQPEIFAEYKVVIKVAGFATNFDVGHFGLIFIHT
jgi:hypothetical protein